MNERGIRKAFIERFEGAVLTPATFPILAVTPTVFENVPNLTDDSWIRTKLNIFNSENGTIGAQSTDDTYILHEGQFVFSIFIRLNIGTRDSSDIVDELVLLYQNKTFSGVWAKVPTPRDIGDDDHGYYMTNLIIPFQTVS